MHKIFAIMAMVLAIAAVFAVPLTFYHG